MALQILRRKFYKNTRPFFAESMPHNDTINYAGHLSLSFFFLSLFFFLSFFLSLFFSLAGGGGKRKIVVKWTRKIVVKGDRKIVVKVDISWGRHDLLLDWLLFVYHFKRVTVICRLFTCFQNYRDWSRTLKCPFQNNPIMTQRLRVGTEPCTSR